MRGEKILYPERAVVPAPARLRPARRDARDADGALVSAGGRVLNVVGSGADVAAARARGLRAGRHVEMRGGWYRRDIAQGGSGGGQPPKSRGVWGGIAHPGEESLERDRAVHAARDGAGLERGAQVRAVVPGRGPGPGGAGQGGHRARRRRRAGRSAPPPTPEAVAAIEAVTGHDVIAFLTAWADNTIPAFGRRVRALRHDLLRPARHRAGGPAHRGDRPADRQGRPAGRGAQRPRAGPPGHAARRADARHPRRARHLGAPGGRLRVRAWRAPGTGSCGPGPR